MSVNSNRVITNQYIISKQESKAALKYSMRNINYSGRSTLNANILNAEWATRGYNKPLPVLPETQAYRFTLTKTTRFIRVSNSLDKNAGQFLMKMEDYQGLTSQQLKSKYASFNPKYAFYADIPAGTIMNCSIANEWYSLYGRGVQYDLNGVKEGIFTFFEVIS